MTPGPPAAYLSSLVAVSTPLWRTTPVARRQDVVFDPRRPESDADILLAHMASIGPLPYHAGSEPADARAHVVRFPLASPSESRFGSEADTAGTWYAACRERTVWAETAWHFLQRKRAAGLSPSAASPEHRWLWSVPVQGERVADLSGWAGRDPRLTANDYPFTQEIGRLGRRYLRGGLHYRSARDRTGSNIALWRETFIGDPVLRGRATLTLGERGAVRVRVEATSGAEVTPAYEFRWAGL